MFLLSMASCSDDEPIPPEKDKESQNQDAKTDEHQSPDEDLHNNGVCDDGESDVDVYCDGKDMIFVHLDKACSRWKDTYNTTVSCFKYVYTVEEADGYTFNQKGICSTANGKPECIRDEEYHCPETATQKDICYHGYRIRYWNFASCGEVESFKDASCTE